MRGKIIKRLGATTLVLTLVSMSLMGGTLAKYTVDVNGETSATVAKFAFDLNGATQDSKSILLTDLFSTTYNTNSVDGGNNKLIAPGTSGKQKIELENKGEVKIAASIEIKETNNGSIPLQYAISEDDTSPNASDAWKDVADLALPADMSVSVGNNTKVFYLHWRWNPNSTDTADTGLGTKASLDTIKLEVSCTVSQVV